MKKTSIALATICLLWTAVATVPISEAATTFAGAIVGIDQVQQTITFQTSTGQTWTMPVANSNILNQQIVKGAVLKIYPGAPHGLTATHRDQFNADMLAFLQTKRAASGT